MQLSRDVEALEMHITSTASFISSKLPPVSRTPFMIESGSAVLVQMVLK